MFAQLNPATRRRQRLLRLGSLALHGALLAWLLHAPEPKLLNPQSVALGENGTSVTRLYWSSKSPDDSTHSSSDQATERYRHERVGKKLTWKAPTQAGKTPRTLNTRGAHRNRGRRQYADSLRARTWRAGRTDLRNADARPVIRR